MVSICLHPNQCFYLSGAGQPLLDWPSRVPDNDGVTTDFIDAVSCSQHILVIHENPKAARNPSSIGYHGYGWETTFRRLQPNSLPETTTAQTVNPSKLDSIICEIQSQYPVLIMSGIKKRPTLANLALYILSLRHNHCREVLQALQTLETGVEEQYLFLRTIQLAGLRFCNHTDSNDESRASFDA